MRRFIVLTLLNISIPFLLRWIWLIISDLIKKQKPKLWREIHEFPLFKLIIVGVLLLAFTLVVLRVFDMKQSPTVNWHSANPSISQSYE